MKKPFSLLSAFSVFSFSVASADPISISEYQPLSWYPLPLLTEEEKAGLPSFCNGKYRIPVIEERTDDSVLVQADASDVDRDGNATLTGTVELHQGNRIMFSNSARWSNEKRIAELWGDVTLITPEFVMEGEKAVLNDTDGQAQLDNAEYAAPSMHFRGSAEEIKLSGEHLIRLDDSTYTFCEPGNNDWDISASEINLDREAGIGSAWNTLLRIKDVPVLYLPYYRFPIDDRRSTGFLDPVILLNGEFQATEIATPFYWNIHPQADATITPRQLLHRGLLWETQFRHLTDTFGYGELNYGFLKDDETDNEDRWLVNYQQRGDISQYWHHRWVYNRISDPDYLNDFSPQLTINRDTHVPTRGEIYFNKDIWHFDIKGESFQTLDENLPLTSRPYKLLPQINFSYLEDNLSGLNLTATTQATRFERDTDDLTGLDALNGDRLVLNTSAAYTFEWPFAYITPKAEYRVRQYNFTNVDPALINNDFDENPSFAIPKYSLDAGMFFERELSIGNTAFTQTLEPRILHLQVPYYDQSEIPDFDTSEVTFNFNQLFRDYRFNGHDRVGDANQTAIGLTTRYIRDEDGAEQFTASVGRIYYHEDRRVQLSGTALDEADRQKVSSTVVESTWTPYDHWRLYGMLEWGKGPDGEGGDEALQEQFSIEYNDKMNHMANIGLRTNEAERIRQLELGLFWSLNDSWSLIGSQKRDIWNYAEGDIEPVDPVLEALVGFEYQNCCWSTQFLYQEQSRRENTGDALTDKNYGFLIRIELKGLTGFGANPQKRLSESIRGYSTRTYTGFGQ